jgi:hypothetical protein
MKQRDRICIALFFVFILIQVSLVYTHEKIHQTIFRSYGVESNIYYYPFSFYKTGAIAQTISEPSNKCKDTCELAHNMNEIIGYNLSYLLDAIFFIAICYFISKNYSDDLNFE